MATADGVGRMLGQMYASDAARKDFNTFMDLLNDSDRIAIRCVDGRKPLTFRRLREFAQTLDLACFGIGRCRDKEDIDRLCVMIPNGPELAVCFLTMSLYCAYAPLNTQLTKAEVEFELVDIPAKAVVVWGPDPEGTDKVVQVATKLSVPIIELVPSTDEAGIFSLRWSKSSPSQLSPLPERLQSRRQDIALLLHTSGTTKKPKIVPLTHENICVGAQCIASTIKITQDDVNMNMMPLYHIHGISINVLASLIVGASTLATPGFDASEAVKWLNAKPLKPNWYSAVPTMHQLFTERAEEAAREGNLIHNLQLIRNCSAALPVWLSTKMENLFKLNVMPTYAMTESMPICSNPRDDRSNAAPARKLGTVGLAGGPYVRILDDAGEAATVGDEGEVCVRGECVTAGYEYRSHMGEGNDPNVEAFHRLGPEKQGWLRTGDKGFVDQDGYLTLVGRFKEIINRAGEKISPLAIEEVLQQHQSCKRLLAFAMPHATYGEVVGVAVVLASGATLELSDLRSFGMTRGLAAIWLPELIIFMSKIPVGSTGKPARINLAGPEKCRYKMQPMGDDSDCVLWRINEDDQVVPADGRQQVAASGTMPAMAIQDTVLDIIASQLRAKGSTITPDSRLHEVGIDSVRIVVFAKSLKERLGCAPPTKAIVGKRISDVCEAMVPLVAALGKRTEAPTTIAAPPVAAAAPAAATISTPLQSVIVDPSARIGEEVTIGHFSIVEPGARIGRGAVIASHCVIEAGAVIGAGCQIGRFTVVGGRVQLGEGTIVDTHCSIGGAGSVRIGVSNRIGSHCRITAEAGFDTTLGDRNALFSHVTLGFSPQDYRDRPPPAGGIRIGNDNVVREGVSIDAACGHGSDDNHEEVVTQIGNGCYLMRNCHVAHDGFLEDSVVLTMGVQLAGYVRVMRNANIGVGALVHQFSTVGPYCMVGMGTVVTRDPLPFTTYMSRIGLSGEGSVTVNRVGLQRAGKRTEQEIDELERFYQDVYSPLGGPLAQQVSSQMWFYGDFQAIDKARSRNNPKRPMGDFLQ